MFCWSRVGESVHDVQNEHLGWVCVRRREVYVACSVCGVDDECTDRIFMRGCDIDSFVWSR